MRPTIPPADRSRLKSLLETYYTRYYRDTLGLPDWRTKVSSRLSEEDVESGRIPKVVEALGRPLAGLRVLNVGCGTGGFNAAAEQAGARTWGIDASDDAIRICEVRRELGAGGRYAQAAAEALPFPDGAFDVVYCLSTLEHVAEVEAAVAEMVRVLRPGGTVLLYAPNAWALYENHYKIFWLPRCPRPLARLYLRLRGRPAGFVDSLNYLSARRCVRLFRRAGTTVAPFGLVRMDGPGSGWSGRLARLYYRALRVKPAIQLMARKETAGRS